MTEIDVGTLLSSNYKELNFFVDYYKIIRPTANPTNEHEYKITATKEVLCWKIEDENLEEINNEDLGILYDAETYIIRWLFNLKVDNELLEKMLVYYWKGQNAYKGYSPLPVEIEQQYPVERLFQWSEPALFFHSFNKKCIVFNGKQSEFDYNIPHLLLIRGEEADETHLYEVPCRKDSLRSRACFLLILPKHNIFLYWYGARSLVDYKNNIEKFELHLHLKKWHKNWLNFSTSEVKEESEPNMFLQALEGDNLMYHITAKANFSPKLFYLNSITGSFLATEVEYALRKIGGIAPFPFLQNHLYSATQPALFLLDNNTDIWLWEGLTDENSNKMYESELKLAKQLQEKYCEEKEKLLGEKVRMLRAKAKCEPIEFTNIFPFWIN